MGKNVERGSIHAIAHLAALVVYRQAFREGKLGRVHADVVAEVYAIAADEFRARRQRAWRIALPLWGVGLVLVWIAWLTDGGPGDLWIQLAVVAGALSSLAVGKAGAYGDAAQLLTRPRLAHLVAAGGACGHRWHAGSEHEHVCRVVGAHTNNDHECACGFWITLAPDWEESS